MPQLRQYISQEASRGRVLNTSRVTQQGVDFSGPVRAAGEIGDTFRRLQEVQDQTSRQLASDEARVQTANTMSEATLHWTERMQQAQDQAPKDAAGFTERNLKEFDEYARAKTDGDMHPESRKLLDNGLRTMRQHLHAESFRFETSQRRKALVEDFGTGLESDRKAVMANPALFMDAMARRVVTAQSIDLPPDVREKLANGSRETLANDAANGLIDKDARGFLERAGLRTARGAKGKQGSQQEDAGARIAADPILSNMAPQQFRTAVDRASMLVSQQEQAAEAARMRALAEQDRRLKHAEAEAKVFQGLYDLGTIISKAETDRTLAATAGTPYQAFVMKMATAANEGASIASQSLAQQKAIRDSIDSKLDLLMQTRAANNVRR